MVRLFFLDLGLTWASSSNSLEDSEIVPLPFRGPQKPGFWVSLLPVDSQIFS